jgi:hypothetical protein
MESRSAIARALVALAPILLTAQTREKRVSPVDSNLRQSFERQAKLAVLVGVGQYPSRSGLNQLRYPARDVDLLEAELKKQGYTTVALKDYEATRGSIVKVLQDAAEVVDRGSGTVLFFFSGHGYADKGGNYLATYEATSSDLAGSGLAVAKVEEMLKATGSPRQVMLLDACRSRVDKGVGSRTFERFETAAGLRVLFSTKFGGSSYERDELRNGVFTHFLVQGLRGDAAGTDGFVTFHDLAEYVTASVRTYGFQHGDVQVPYEAGEATGDFLIGGFMRGSEAGSAIAVVPPTPPAPDTTIRPAPPLPDATIRPTPPAPNAILTAKALKARSKAELEAWNSMVAVFNDPDKAIAAAENLITRFADTEFKTIALNIEADAYQKKGDFNKMEIYADRVLEVNPQDSQALLMLAKYYATHTRENDLDREEKLGKAEKYANLVVEVAKTLPKPSAQFSDEQWIAARKDTAAEAYNAIGQANLVRKEYDAAAAGFKSAVDSSSAPEPAYMVRLALALQKGGKDDEAIVWCDKAAAVLNVHPQVKAVAAQIRATAVKSGGKAK